MRGRQRILWAYIGALLLVLGPSMGMAIAAEKPFVAPVEAQVTRGFDQPANRFAAGHRGIDYDVPVGTSVTASGAGTVSFAGRTADDGMAVTVQHVGGIATTYSYLSRVDVSKGDQVAQGQVIGHSGEGHDGGPALLHFGAKRNGEYIDPEILLSNFDDITDLISLVPVSPGVSTSGAAFRALPSFPLKGGSTQTSVQPTGSLGVGMDPEVAFTQFTGPVVNPELPDALSRLPVEADVRHVEEAPAPRGTKEVTSGKRNQTQLQWWNELEPEFRDELIDQSVEKRATEVGIPARIRDDINRKLLDQRIKELEEYRNSPAGQREVMLQEFENVGKFFLNPISVRSKFDREASIDRKLRSAKALKAQLSAVAERKPNQLRAEDVYLLDFDIDFADGDGKAVVALGDPGTAEHIGVLVPGINNAVGSIDGALEDAAVLRSQVHRTMTPDLAKRTSTVVWMGYDNPNGLHDAANRGEAHEGAPNLERFINDLRAGHATSPQTPHITVFGHSYGSTVTGLAALAGMKADDVVFYGSPGVGNFFVDASDFPQKRIWAAESLGDPINWVNATLGTNPAAPWFGARKVPLGRENKGHSDYILRDSKATINFARILTGRLRDIR